MGTTTDPNDPRLGYGSDDKPTLMNGAYLVLSKDEIAKGFVRPVRQSYWHTVCGKITTMNIAIAETYARNPAFYGSTYCVHCQMHKPVGINGEFYWCDNDNISTMALLRQDKVGT